jgi:Amt family ammonium transporter
MIVAVNTTLAAVLGGITAMIFSWIFYKKPDLSLSLNGMLAGLVAITANCHCVSNYSALAIGGIAGVLVCAACWALDRLQIDDPVGAFPVHGVCGMWGGIATGIFGVAAEAGFGEASLSLTTQIIGTLAIAGWAFGTSLILFFGLKAIGQLRVSPEEEVEGLDIHEHGMYAYPPQLVVDAFPGARPPAGAVYQSSAIGAKVLETKPSTQGA